MEETYCVENCKKCPRLVENRTQIVNGTGPMDAELLLVGEAPGENEDSSGEPFVGRSGTLLDEALEKEEQSRDSIRITNTVRCRPPDNSDPTQKERENCYDFLKEEILSVNPNLIVCLGKVPSEYLLQRPVKVTEEFGTVSNPELEGIEAYDCIISIHPALALYQGSYRENFYDIVSRATQVADL